MTRFVTYDAEVANRLAQAVGVHRVELRESQSFSRTAAIHDAIHSRPSAILMPASDEQVLLVKVADVLRSEDAESRPKRKRSKRQAEPKEIHEIGTQPTGFLGLQDEPVFDSNDEEEPPRSLWKKED